VFDVATATAGRPFGTCENDARREASSASPSQQGAARRSATVGRVVVCVVRTTIALAALGVTPANPGAAAQSGPTLCAGEVPCKLTEGLPAGTVINVQVSPDGRQVLIKHRRSELGFDELYSVPADGSSPAVKLSPPDGRVGDVLISPDSSRVVYDAQIPLVGSTLFSVPIAGPSSSSLQLSTEIGGNTPAISPNGRLVVYQSVRRERLLAVPIEGPESATVQLTKQIELGREIQRFQISPDGKSIVYQANQDDVNAVELYRVPLTIVPEADPPTAKLNAPLVAGGRVRDFWFSPTNAPVVYLADQDVFDVPELFAVRLGGAGRVKLNLHLPPNWEVGASTIEEGVPVRISADGSRVAYQIQEKVFQGRAAVQLFSVPITGPGTQSVRLDLPPADALDARSQKFAITSDSARVVHVMIADNDGQAAPVLSLFSVPAAGPAEANTMLGTSLFDDDIVLSPDGARAVWRGGTSLFSSSTAPTPGDAPVLLTGDEQEPEPILIDPASTQGIYTAFTGVDIEGLFRVPLDGSRPSENLTSSLIGRIDDVVIAPDGGRVVYTLRDSSDREDVYSSSLVRAAEGQLVAER
jgi:dipeptidyl aminopeptidase/acylaminoacyl peptidase